jgi:hypothetical protein
VYEDHFPGPGRVHAVDADGTDRATIVSSAWAAPRTGPEWSPAGHRIAYTNHYAAGGPTSQYDVFTVPPDGSVITHVGSFSEHEIGRGQPAWSPDGGQMAVIRNGRLYVMTDAGTGLHVVTPDSCFDSDDPDCVPAPGELAGNPDWQPLPPAPVKPGYPRPGAASRVSVSLVPAYEQCSTPNRTHGPPLAFGSCSPPAQVSDGVTMGTADANGRGTNSVGRVSLHVVAGDPLTPADDADVIIHASLTDVRCRVSWIPVCANGSALSDYTGALDIVLDTRATDRFNGGSATDPATVQDDPLEMRMNCATTADSTIGSTCEVNTSVDALTPGTALEGKLAVWELGRVWVRDAGFDGDPVNSQEPLAVQGVLVP